MLPIKQTNTILFIRVWVLNQINIATLNKVKFSFRKTFEKLHKLYLLITQLQGNVQVELEEEAWGERSPVLHLTARCSGCKRQIFSQQLTSFLYYALIPSSTRESTNLITIIGLKATLPRSHHTTQRKVKFISEYKWLSKLNPNSLLKWRIPCLFTSLKYQEKPLTTLKLIKG